jgi:hypothetical protein
VFPFVSRLVIIYESAVGEVPRTKTQLRPLRLAEPLPVSGRSFTM